MEPAPMSKLRKGCVWHVVSSCHTVVICLLHYANHASHTKITGMVNVTKFQRVQSMPSPNIISLSLIRTQHFIKFYCEECIWNLKKFWNSAISNDHLSVYAAWERNCCVCLLLWSGNPYAPHIRKIFNVCPWQITDYGASETNRTITQRRDIFLLKLKKKKKEEAAIYSKLKSYLSNLTYGSHLW